MLHSAAAVESITPPPQARTDNEAEAICLRLIENAIGASNLQKSSQYADSLHEDDANPDATCDTFSEDDQPEAHNHFVGLSLQSIKEARFPGDALDIICDTGASTHSRKSKRG